jgi:hypothetical protein
MTAYHRTVSAPRFETLLRCGDRVPRRGGPATEAARRDEVMRSPAAAPSRSSRLPTRPAGATEPVLPPR